MEIFTHVPDRGFSKTTTPRVLTTQFGDGYAHRLADGINNLKIDWNLTFNDRPLSAATEIISFLEVAGGVTPFFWTPPDEITQYRVICSEWNLTYVASIARSVSAKFQIIYQ